MSRGGSKGTWASGAILEEVGSSGGVAVCGGIFEWRVIAIDELITIMYFTLRNRCRWRETRSYVKLTLARFTRAT